MEGWNSDARDVTLTCRWEWGWPDPWRGGWATWGLQHWHRPGHARAEEARVSAVSLSRLTESQPYLTPLWRTPRGAMVLFFLSLEKAVSLLPLVARIANRSWLELRPGTSFCKAFRRTWSVAPVKAGSQLDAGRGKPLLQQPRRGRTKLAAAAAWSRAEARCLPWSCRDLGRVSKGYGWPGWARTCKDTPRTTTAGDPFPVQPGPLPTVLRAPKISTPLAVFTKMNW